MASSRQTQQQQQLVESESNKKVVPISKEYYESSSNEDADDEHHDHHVRHNGRRTRTRTPTLETMVSLAKDGTVDCSGKPIDKRTSGRLRANFFIIGIEIGERLAFYGMSANLVTYLTHVLHEGTAVSAKNVNNWIGTTFLAPLLGAFLADAYWGRFWTIFIFSTVYLVGLIMLTLSVTMAVFKPPECDLGAGSKTSTGAAAVACPSATAGQVGFFYFSLYLISVGAGSMKPCVAAFGADQFDEEDAQENGMKKSFFNWWVFGISIGGLLSATVFVYIQDYVGWGWGFGVPTVLMAMFLCAFVSGFGFYRHKRPMGSPLSRIAQVFVASVCKWRLEVPADSQLLFEIRDKESVVPGSRRIPHSNSFRFLDKAAILGPLQQQPEEEDARAAAAAGKTCKEIIISSSPWRLSTVTQVEEVKLVLRLLPIWVAALLFATLPAQISTFYTRQGTTLDINLGPNFQIPAASLQSLIPITIVTLIPLYDRVFVPVVRHFTGNVRGITMLQRIGIGIFISILSMVAAAITEIKRVKVAKEHGLLDQPNSTIPMSVFVLLPQYVLLGTAEVFTSIGALEFFYDQAPDSMRSLGTALFLSTIGVGNFLSSLLLTAIVKVTRLGGGHHHPPQQSGWIVDNLNRCRLDYFYWLLAGLSGLNLCFFMALARWYSYKKINKTTDF